MFLCAAPPHLLSPSSPLLPCSDFLSTDSLTGSMALSMSPGASRDMAAATAARSAQQAAGKKGDKAA